MTRRPGRGAGSPKVYIPDRGDILWIDLNPQAGREQAGRRPCLVLSPADYNGKTGLAVVCPVTGQAKGYPFEVALPAALATKGVVLSDHIKNLDWRVRKAEFREKVPEAVVREVLDMATTLLDPSDRAEKMRDADEG